MVNPTFLMLCLKVFILSSISTLIFFLSSSVFLDSFILDMILFNNCSRNCCCHLQLFNENHLIILNKTAHDLLSYSYIVLGPLNLELFVSKGQRTLLKINKEFYKKNYRELHSKLREFY